MNLLRYCLLSLSVCGLLGCAHASRTSTDTTSKEPAAMADNTTDQVHTLAGYPELTPEGMGRKFLQFLDSLTSFDLLTPEFLERQMGVKLTPEPQGGYFTMQLSDSDRRYAVGYYRDPNMPISMSAKLWFSSTSAQGDGDMTPMCGMDFEAYRTGLEQIGFKDTGREDHDHLGRLPYFYYRRGDLVARIGVRRQSEENPHQLCVEKVDVGFGG